MISADDAGGSVESIAIVSNATLNVTNNGGTIQATGFNGVGVLGSDTTTVQNNGGTISGSLDGVNTNTAATTSITNSGMIAGTGRDGIRVNTASITNNAGGTVTGATGIFFRAGNGPSTVFNAGTITGTGGTAIQFSTGSVGNTLTLGPGFVINGNVLGAGSDIFQLGGTTGTGSFNLSNIGAQYTGFGTFNVISQTWNATGTSSQNWTIFPGATLQLVDGNAGNGGNGTITGNVTDNGTFAVNRSDTYTFGSLISGTGAVQQNGTGTLVLTNVDTYNGATTVNAGTLEVDGSIATSILATVNGGTLSGIGVVGNTQINTGTLAPGNTANPTGTLTVTGSLTFQSAAFYMVGISGSNASKAGVSGMATLGGATVTIANGSTPQIGTTYTILTATSGVSGTFNPTVTFGNLTGTLSYDPNDVFLTFNFSTITPLLPPGAPVNVVNVANAISNFTSGGGALPAGFQTLFNFSPSQLVNALSQLDGEAATDAEKGAFALMTQFLDLMLDPFVDGRSGGLGAGASNFAPEREASFPPDIAVAYGAVLKAPPKPTFDRRWTVWGAGFGGANNTNGNAAIGSNNVRASDFGFVVGADYHYSPDTVFGFALAGAGTNWGLAQGLGGGRSDAFMAGGYGITHLGPIYLAGDFAFANHWFTTNRTALGDQLTARFNGQSYGARVEAGYRYAMPVNAAIVGVTPYAALQSQWFHTGSFNETDPTGGGFGLAFNAMNANDTRSELGAHFDDLTTLGGMPVQLRARVAWAHDWVTNPTLGAVFQALPGAAFTVNGAAPPKNSALTTAGAQFYLTPQLSFLVKFEGEFASGSQTYAGTGTVRYQW